MTSLLLPVVGQQSQAYGLRLQSNLAVPGLPLASDRGEPDVRIWLGTLPPGLTAGDAAPVAPSDSGILFWNDGRFHRLRYADETEFAFDQAGSEIYAIWPNSLSLEDTAVYLLGPILSLVLRIRGTVTLHASVVCIDDVAVALIGPQGAGKSTTAASFAMAGYGILTDDVAAIRDDGTSFHALPAYPRVRLWPASVETLFGKPDALPLLTPTWDKRYLDLDCAAYLFETRALPLAAIYFFEPRSDEPDAPSIAAEPLRDGLVRLIGNLGGNYLLDLPSAPSFEILHRLAGAVPLRRLTPHSDASRLPEMRDLVVADVRALREESDPAAETPDQS